MKTVIPQNLGKKLPEYPPPDKKSPEKISTVLNLRKKNPKKLYITVGYSCLK